MFRQNSPVDNTPGTSSPSLGQCLSMRGCCLTLLEREMIENRLKLHCSYRSIGRTLGRDHTVIGREVGRNSMRNGKYSSVFAQELALKRERKRRGKKRKIDKNDRLREHVISSLKEGKSPDVIAGRMKKEPPPLLEGMTICHESIYQWIYEGEGGEMGMYRYLCAGRKRRWKKGSRKYRGNKAIPNRISIHERGEDAGARIRVGHWETDSVCYPGSGKQRLSVQTEKKARFVQIHRLLSGNAQDTLDAIRESIASVSGDQWKTITFDNGGEGALHGMLKDDYSIDTYFCDPYCSWQKGQVENMNRIIRRYLPRGTDLRTVSNQTIYEIQNKINDTPRKILGYKTPREVLQGITG
jgi:transposase, IS30 family